MFPALCAGSLKPLLNALKTLFQPTPARLPNSAKTPKIAPKNFSFAVPFRPAFSREIAPPLCRKPPKFSHFPPCPALFHSKPKAVPDLLILHENSHRKTFTTYLFLAFYMLFLNKNSFWNGSDSKILFRDLVLLHCNRFYFGHIIFIITLLLRFKKTKNDFKFAAVRNDERMSFRVPRVKS